MSIYPVERGIPVFPRGKGNPGKYPWSNLDVGDSFFVPCKLTQAEAVMNALTSCRQWAQEKTGCKFVLRTVRSPYKGKTGVRAWRIK